MARLASDARLGFFPAPPEAVEAILTHLQVPVGQAEHCPILDPCCGEALAIKQIAEGLAIPPSHVYAVELDTGRAERARENLPYANVLGPASFMGTQITGCSFSLVYVNPPFSTEIGGGRREEQTFVARATRLLAPHGILVLVCPVSALQYNTRFIEYLDAYYENAALYRFPDEVRHFKELVFIAQKRRIELPQAQGFLCEQRLHAYSRPDDPEVGSEPRQWTLVPSVRPSRFCKIEYTEDELIAAVERSPLGRRLEPPAPPAPKTPPLPLAKGHVALLLASGMLDGLVEPEGEPPHVVRGTARKLDYISERSQTENEVTGATTEKVVWSQRIVLTVRAVGPDGEIKTFEDGTSSEAPKERAEVKVVAYVGGDEEAA
jgi:predicted RNA methylase